MREIKIIYHQKYSTCNGVCFIKVIEKRVGELKVNFAEDSMINKTVWHMRMKWSKHIFCSFLLHNMMCVKMNVNIYNEILHVIDCPRMYHWQYVIKC